MRQIERTDLETLDLETLCSPDKGERVVRDAIVECLAIRVRATGARSWIVFGKRDGRTVRDTLGGVAMIPLPTARRMANAHSPSCASPPRNDPLMAVYNDDTRISDLLAEFLKARPGMRWKESTLRNMRAMAAVHILPFIGARKVAAITRQEVTRWHADVAARSKSVRMALSTLSGLMLYAEDHGLREAGTNPCKGLRRKERSRRGRPLPASTVRDLWQALDKVQTSKPDACDAIRLLMLTGARRSEILSLEWDRIVGSRAILADSKEGPRTIWLNAPARAILNARREQRTGQYVFPAERSEGPMKVIDRAWKQVCVEAGITGLRVHDLRHHFASVAVSNGVDLRLVGQLLGHVDIDSTLGYAHLGGDALMKSATRVSGLIDRSLRGESARGRLPKRPPTRTENVHQSKSMGVANG